MMLEPGSLTFHHFGLASDRPESCAAFLSALGYQLGETIHDPEQNVQLALATHPHQPTVEIVSPGPTPGPISAIIAANRHGIYHLCYECDDAAAAVASMKQRGLRVVCVSPAKKALLFGGRRVSFYNVSGFGLIELLEPAQTGAP
jgi:methylmalonyl-CoA/ethylmalonyl-CoA epimerase